MVVYISFRLLIVTLMIIIATFSVNKKAFFRKKWVNLLKMGLLGKVYEGYFRFGNCFAKFQNRKRNLIFQTISQQHLFMICANNPMV